MGEVEMISCVLCSGLLPRGEVEVVKQHMKEQHRVYTNLPLVVGASKLERMQLELVFRMVMDMQDVKDISEENERTQEALAFPKSHSKKVDSEIEMDIKPKELDEEDIVKFELLSEPDNEHDEPLLQVKRKYKKRKNGRALVGKIDKIIEKSGYEPDRGPCVCPICTKEFVIPDEQSEKYYRRHIYQHRVTKWECNCGVAFIEEKQNLSKKFHIYTVHRGMFHCPKCNEAFKEKDLYTNHMIGHGDLDVTPSHICDDCGFTARTKYLVSNHKAYKHDSKLAICDVCSEEFPGRLKMMIHKRRVHLHGGKKQCPHCGDTYSQLWKHIKVMHTEDKDKLHSCPLCERGFIERSRMDAHMRSAHTGEKPFPCRFLCGAACAEAGNRKKHEITR